MSSKRIRSHSTSNDSLRRSSFAPPTTDKDEKTVLPPDQVTDGKESSERETDSRIVTECVTEISLPTMIHRSNTPFRIVVVTSGMLKPNFRLDPDEQLQLRSPTAAEVSDPIKPSLSLAHLSLAVDSLVKSFGTTRQDHPFAEHKDANGSYKKSIRILTLGGLIKVENERQWRKAVGDAIKCVWLLGEVKCFVTLGNNRLTWNGEIDGLH